VITVHAAFQSEAYLGRAQSLSLFGRVVLGMGAAGVVPNPYLPERYAISGCPRRPSPALRLAEPTIEPILKAGDGLRLGLEPVQVARRYVRHGQRVDYCPNLHGAPSRTRDDCRRMRIAPSPTASPCNGQPICVPGWVAFRCRLSRERRARRRAVRGDDLANFDAVHAPAGIGKSGRPVG
jgi:hypothetical protein